MWQDVDDYVKDCKYCENSERTHKGFKPELNPVPLPSKPWEKVGLDIKSLLECKKPKYLLVMQDYYSEWPEVFPMQTITARNVAKILDQVFSRMGNPIEVVTDNGKQFVADLVEKFLESRKIRHRLVPLYAPSQNGLVERLNSVVGYKIEECLKFKWNVDEVLERTLLDYRSTPHSTTGMSPFELMFGRKMNNELTQLVPNLDGGEGKDDFLMREKVERLQKK